jgi:hypothetical protein
MYGIITTVSAPVEMYDGMHAEMLKRVGTSIDGLLVHVGRATADGFETVDDRRAVAIRCGLRPNSSGTRSRARAVSSTTCQATGSANRVCISRTARGMPSTPTRSYRVN